MDKNGVKMSELYKSPTNYLICESDNKVLLSKCINIVKNSIT